jgi:hypothetical protein
MRELDRLDAKYGLGAMPVVRARKRPRPRRPLVSSLVGVAVVAAACGLLAVSPDEAGTTFRRLTGINRPHRLLPPVATSDGSGVYAVVNEQPSGEPVTYDPCDAIHYVVNPVDGPADSAVFIEAAVREAQAASGLRFVYDGLSDEHWSSRSHGTSRRPVLFTFNRPAEVPELAGEVAGLGGSLAMSSGGRAPRYITGSIALDSAWFLNASADGRMPEEKAIVMHELGHVIGLDHVTDPRQLMFAENVGQLDYGPGDRAGLARLGAGPCD